MTVVEKILVAETSRKKGTATKQTERSSYRNHQMTKSTFIYLFGFFLFCGARQSF